MAKKKETKTLSDLGQLKVTEIIEDNSEPEIKEKPSKVTEVYKDMDKKSIFSSESILTAAEKKFYTTRRAEYLKDFQMNSSSDIGLIHRVLMEEIICERLLKMAMQDPTSIPSDLLSESHKRYKTNLEALGANRDKRIKNREASGVSVADAAKEYFSGKQAKQKEINKIWDDEDRALEESQLEMFASALGAAGILEDEDE